MDQKIHCFWPDHKIEEDFINLFLNACFVMLENPNNIKNIEVKEMIFDLLQKTMQNYGAEMKFMMTQNTSKIINLLYN